MCVYLYTLSELVSSDSVTGDTLSELDYLMTGH